MVFRQLGNDKNDRPIGPKKIGVYLCECGPNIGDAMDLEGVADFVRGIEDAAVVRRFGLLCSAEGKELIRKDIVERGLERVVIGACSPKEHERTFREVLESAGLNPFLLQVANLREQCAWVTEDKKEAGEKAKRMLSAAIRRAARHEPLSVQEIACRTEVLVVGAGIAGLSAALTLAREGRKVYMVEQSPCIGGKAVRYEALFPSMACGSCLLDPKLDEALHHPNIEVLTLSRLEEAVGSFGNFTVSVRKRARRIDEETCIGCGACTEVCPVTVKNEFSYGMNRRRAVYIPYAGALPNAAVVDEAGCLRLKGVSCTACRDVCPFGSVRYEDSDQVRELNVGAIILATGFDLFDPRKRDPFGIGKIENVFTGLEFEEILNASGPTKGRIALANGSSPRKVVLIHCVGSRSEAFHGHCSGVCCTYLMKFSRQILDRLPEASITHLYTDLCLPGKGAQNLHRRLSKEKQVRFRRMADPDGVRFSKEGERVVVECLTPEGEALRIAADLAVLAPAVTGVSEARELASTLDVSTDENGFFEAADPQLEPISSPREGIFIAGCAQGPKGVPAAVADGQAAAGGVISRLVPGRKLKLEPTAARVEESLCSGCRICLDQCRYKAIQWDPVRRRVSINALLCSGCGNCAAVCPGGAIEARHFKDEQVAEEIKGLLGGT